MSWEEKRILYLLDTLFDRVKEVNEKILSFLLEIADTELAEDEKLMESLQSLYADSAAVLTHLVRVQKKLKEEGS